MSQHLTELFRTSCGASAPLELNVAGPDQAHGERHVFESPFVLVGRHERSCLRLDDGEVSRRHAYLQQLGGRVFCVDLGSRRGIRWNGKPRPTGLLRPEQGVQIGPFTLEPVWAAAAGENAGDVGAQVWDPLQDRANDTRFLPRITVEVGNEVLSRLYLNRMLVLVGSSPACRLRLRDVRVSRYHCSLVSTPQGVWLIDLLSGSGSRVNGEVLRWALLKEGDRLQVGPYVLRIRYPNVRTQTPSSSLVEVPTATRVQPADRMPESGPQPSWGRNDVQPSVLVSALQAELEQARERQRDAESLRQQLADSQTECDRLQEQMNELEVVRLERERWQTEAQDLHARLEAHESEQEQLGRLVAELNTAQAEQERLQSEQKASQQSAEQAWSRVTELERALVETSAEHVSALEEAHAGWESERQTLEAQSQTHQAAIRDVQVQSAAERQEWQQRLEAAQQQLVQGREAVSTANARLDHELATLLQVRTDLASRNAEHEAALLRLQQTQEEMALAQNEMRSLQAELEQVRERQCDAESLRQQLADSQTECERLQEQMNELEVVRLERERWQTEAQDLQTRLATQAAEQEQVSRVLSDLRAVQVEQERLQSEQKASQQAAEQAWSRVAELERALAEGAAAGASALEQVRAGWESERQAREAQSQTQQAAVRDVQAQSAAERQEWQQRLEAAQQQLVQEREAVSTANARLDHELATLLQVRTDLAVRNAEHEAALQRLLQTQEDMALAREETRSLQAQLDQARERQCDAESLRQQLADSQTECDRLQELVNAREGQVAEAVDLQARLEAAEADARELEVVRRERERWQTEARDLHARLESHESEQEQLGRLVAELNTAQAEQERLQSEQKASQQSAEQAWSRVAELERALAEAATAQASPLEEARSGWESERHALEARLEAQGQSHQAAIRDVQARAALEREEWRQRLQGAEMQLVWERGMFQEQSDQIRQQAARLQAERDQLAAQLSQAELKLRAAEKRSPNETSPVADLQHPKQLAAREQVFVQLSSIRTGQLFQQTARGQRPDAPTEQARASASLFREGGLSEEQRRLTAIAQEVQAAWGEAPVGPEHVSAVSNPVGRAGGQLAEASSVGGGNRQDERRSPSVLLAVPANEEEPSTPSAAPLGSPVSLGEIPLAGDALGCVPEQKDNQPEARPSFWRKIVNRVLGE